MAQGLARWVVRLAALLVPAARRADWRREWLAELAHADRTLPARRLLGRSLLSLGDAWSVRGRGRPEAAPPKRATLLEGVGGDARLALRALRRTPEFTTVALLTFGLGIGVNATVFAAVDAVLFRPLDYAEPAALVSVDVVPGASVSKATLVELRIRTHGFDGLAGWSRWGFSWTGEGPARLVTGARATSDLFEVLGVVPAIGRLLEAGDDAPGAEPVAVASWGFWRAMLGGDRTWVGRTLVLDGVGHTLVGVTPPGFAFPDGSADLFLATTLDQADESDWTAGYLQVLGRMQRGVIHAAAHEDVRAAMAALRADRGAGGAFGASAVVRDLRAALVGSARAPLLALLASVTFVLLVACANLANLLLSRTSGRQAELAVRRALGASPGRITRQLLVESAVLSLAGVVVGLTLAWGGVALANGLLPASLPGAGAVALDGRVVSAAVCAALVAGLAAGLVPSVRGAHAAPAGALGQRAGTGGAGSRRLQAALVAAEVSLAVLLVTSAGMALRTVRDLLQRETGYETEGVMTVVALPPAARYGDDARLRTYWQDALSRVRALPGVTAAGAVHLAPFGGSDWNPELVIEDRPAPPGERRPDVGWRVVTPGWFAASGITLLEGRDFDARDVADGVRVAIVNESLARRFWPDGSALGRRVRTFFESGEWAEIVGVVADTRDLDLDRDVRPQMYRPYTQHTTGSMMIAARWGGRDAAASAGALRQALESVDDDVPLIDLRPFDTRIAESAGRERLVARLLGAFAALALVLGAVGIYGVTAYAVGRRRRELGVRSALGANRSDLMRMVLAETTRVAAVGAAAGTALAVAAGRVAASRMANVHVPGAGVLAAAALTLLAVAVAAAWLPALRASRTDPQRTFRDD